MGIWYDDDSKGGDITCVVPSTGTYNLKTLEASFDDEIDLIRSVKNRERFFVVRRHRIDTSHYNSAASRVLTRDHGVQIFYVFGPVLHVHQTELEIEVLMRFYSPSVHPRVVEF